MIEWFTWNSKNKVKNNFTSIVDLSEQFENPSLHSARWAIPSGIALGSDLCFQDKCLLFLKNDGLQED